MSVASVRTTPSQTRHATLLAIDSDQWACATYRANHDPHNPHAAHDADRVVCGEVHPDLVAPFAGKLDLLCGGPPCQPFSTAGTGRGKDDDRDGLPVFRECVRASMPRQVLMENVPGMLGEDHIAHYGQFLEGLESLGYRTAHKTLDAADFGVPQFRKRVWTWAIRDDINGAHFWPTPTHRSPNDADTLFGSFEPWVTAGEALGIVGPKGRIDGASGWSGQRIIGADEPAPAVTGAGNNPDFIRRLRGASVERPDHPLSEPSPTVTVVDGGGSGLAIVTKRARSEQPSDNPAPTVAADGRDSLVDYRWSDEMKTKHPPASPDTPSPTVVSKWYKGGAEGLVEIGEKVRRLTPDECARLQSVPDNWIWPDGITKTAKYRIIGNGWACGMAAHMARALRAADPFETVVDLFCGGGLGAVGMSGRYWGPTRGHDEGGREDPSPVPPSAGHPLPRGEGAEVVCDARGGCGGGA